MIGALLHHILELAVVQVGVEAAGGQQLVVGALLHDVAVPHHKDEVGVLDGCLLYTSPSPRD